MNHQHHHESTPQLSLHPPLRDYIPLGVVFAAILVGTFSLMLRAGFTLDGFLGYSMGLFFVIFAMFKLMDLFNFVHGYHEYDIIAQKIFAWGYVYPFVELALGALYLSGYNSPWLHVITIFFAVVTCTSVGIKLARREVVQCACLGTVLKVPITYISLIEYALMGLMALVVLTK